MSLRVISSFGFTIDLETTQDIELYVDIVPHKEKKDKRILLVIEPNEFSGIRDSIIFNKRKFDLILTWDDVILNSCENSKLFAFGTTWIKDFDYEYKKEFCVTTLIGGKAFLPGHQLRHQLINLKDLNIKLDIFNSKNLAFNNSFKTINDPNLKNEMFYSQFHIAIENLSINNWFTEKLIDCFQSKTIPIYFGCPNISDFFDVRGMFIVNNLDDIRNVCNSLNEETYHSKLEWIEKNYELSKEYLDLKERVKKEILILNDSI